MDKEITIIVGIPHSGKTTYAQTWVSEDPIHRIVVNIDEIRKTLSPYYIIKNDRFIYYALGNLIYTAKRHDKQVLIDGTYITEFELAELSELCDDFYYRTPKYHYMTTSLEDCIKYDELSSKPLGKDIITKLYCTYQQRFGSKICN